MKNDPEVLPASLVVTLLPEGGRGYSSTVTDSNTAIVYRRDFSNRDELLAALKEAHEGQFAFDNLLELLDQKSSLELTQGVLRKRAVALGLPKELAEMK